MLPLAFRLSISGHDFITNALQACQMQLRFVAELSQRECITASLTSAEVKRGL